jgi:cyclopropane fatty-acyl-phospholipid synthase-like methyltransferase
MTQFFYAHEPAGLRKEQFIRALVTAEAGRVGKQLRILDVGCGLGHLSASMASTGNEVVAIDPDELSIMHAQNLYGEAVKFFMSTIEAQAGPFDIITAFEVCEHISNRENFLAAVKNHLAPGGLLIISVPNGWSLEEMVRRFLQQTGVGRRIKTWLRKGALPKCTGQSASDSPHVHFNSLRAWRSLFRSSGFTEELCVSVSYFVKQFFYLGGRRLVRPGGRFMRSFEWLDANVLTVLPTSWADGWLMSWRAK